MEFIQTNTGGLLVGHDSSGAQNGLAQTLTGTIARTDTTAKILGFMPANAIVTGVRIYNPAVSDAGTTAVISVGTVASGTAVLNTADIKGGALGQLIPTTKATLGTIGGIDVTIKGIYAETGGASTTGGPWRVFVDYVLL